MDEPGKKQRRRQAQEKTVYMLGGTSEANLAARHLELQGYRVVMSVATPLGAELAAGAEKEVGPRDASGLAASAAGAGAAAIVDCTHPFAIEASRAARSAAGSIGVPYLRFTRADEPLEGAHIIRVDGWQRAVAYLEGSRKRALLAIGVRNLHLFSQAGLDFAVRILPQPESLGRCRELGIAADDIIAAQPPHDLAFNRCCIRRARASVLVSKDSGREGGLPEKARAAAAEGIELLLISKPGEPDAFTDPRELLAALRRNTRRDSIKYENEAGAGK